MNQSQLLLYLFPDLRCSVLVLHELVVQVFLLPREVGSLQRSIFADLRLAYGLCTHPRNNDKKNEKTALTIYREKHGNFVPDYLLLVSNHARTLQSFSKLRPAANKISLTSYPLLR